MRVPWNKRRGLTVLMATVMALQGAGAARAQFMQYGSQDQTQPQSNSAQQSLPGDAAQPQTQQPARRYATPQYTAMAYFGDDFIAANSVSPTPAQDINGQAQAASTLYQDGSGRQGGFNNDRYTYSTFDRGSGYRYGCYDDYYGSGCLPGRGCGDRWFGGVYGLVMERGNANRVPLAFVTTNAVPYFPTDAEIALTTRDADIGYQGGIEIRFGAYFGGHIRSGCGCGPSYAWESVYWGIFEDSATATITDVTADANRTYGMIDFLGLEFDPGTGFRSVNVFYDSGLPTVDNSAPYDVEVRSLSVRNTFQVQNVEANLLRLPVLNGGGYGGSPPRYELITLLGARFMRLDEDFWFRSDYERMDTNALGFVAYNVQTDNTMYGFQVGGNGVYRLGRSGRLSLHCNSAVGLYGNHIEVAQWIDSPTGGIVRFANGATGTFLVESEKDDVSMVGEMRLGASYQGHRNWRIYGGWRVVGMTGLALATDQIPPAFLPQSLLDQIALSGSIILRGLQTGMEFTY